MKDALKEHIARYEVDLHKVRVQHDAEVKDLALRFAKSIALKPGTAVEDAIGRAEIIEMTAYTYGCLGAPLPVYRAKNLTKKGNVKKRVPVRKVYHETIDKIY